MRTPWQGSEGIAWLAVAPTAEIEGGAFYLDRKPQTKHLAGYFMAEGTFTKNSPEEVFWLLLCGLPFLPHFPNFPAPSGQSRPKRMFCVMSVFAGC